MPAPSSHRPHRLPCRRALPGAVVAALLLLPGATRAGDAGVPPADASRDDVSALGAPTPANPFAFGLTAGAGQVNSSVSRELLPALGFNLSSALLGVAVSSSDPQQATLDFAKLNYFSSNWTEGSLSWFGSRSSGGLELLPLDTLFLQTQGRGYLIYRPTVAYQQRFFTLRAAPMAGRGYGQTPDGSGSRIFADFAGFDVGIDGMLSSAWFTESRFRVQSGASIDAYEDLTGHLGQVAADGVINDDTMTGIAWLELVYRAGPRSEWALGWKASYDRLSPYDAALKEAARNEDTAIGIYLRWSGGAQVGSPAVGATF